MWTKPIYVFIILLSSIQDRIQFGTASRIHQRTQTLKNRIQDRIIKYRERHTQHVCYEQVGCFSLPHKKSPLQKVPEDPKIIDTKFYLFTRGLNFSNPELITSLDGSYQLNSTSFAFDKPLKMVMHGYMGIWNQKGSLVLSDAYLQLYDCNIILVDWHKGARGPQYPAAAANTEVVGRIVGYLLLDMVNKGFNPKNIHLIGFSLGAHIAGTASEILKNHKHLIGRITGLDPASPLFRSNYLREKHKKLDSSDAEYVDVLHTDSSPSVTDGFGLWEPIGHVDFYANGGQEQPGCTDVQGSILLSTFERNLSMDIACSHIRAFHLFIESVVNKLKKTCQFVAFSCHGGLKGYERGQCFADLASNNSLSISEILRTEIGVFGEDSRGEGSQVQVSIDVSEQSSAVEGNLFVQMKFPKQTINVQIPLASSKFGIQSQVHGFGVANYNSLKNEIGDVPTEVYFFQYRDEKQNVTIPQMVYLNTLSVKDMYGKSWKFCQKNMGIMDTQKTSTHLKYNHHCKA